MIALKGRLSRNDQQQWRWTGRWAFGKAVDEASSLPFAYAWQQAVAPAAVAVPSLYALEAEQDHEEEEKESKEEVKPVEATAENKEAEATEQTTTSERKPEDAARKPAADTLASTEQPGETTLSLESNVTKKVTTFADKDEPSDPDFVDACGKHPNLPASGEWKGHFERASTTRKAATAQVHESCYLFFNAAPPSKARRYFPDDEEEDEIPADSKLSPGRIHVRGTGENQYGIFELLGELDPTTMELSLQRLYVITPSTPRNKSRRRASTTPDSGESGDRPVTRKRQMSWKIRASFDEAEEDEPSRQRKRNKRLSVTIPLGSVSVGGLDTKNLTPRRTASLSPRPSVKKRLTPAMRTPSVPMTGNGGVLKLPAVGEPHKARWRAAHFLYYHRNEPDEESVDGSVSAAPSNPKYVVYEGELYHNHRDGRGVCLYSNEMLYEGDWKRDKEHGVGTLMTADRSRTIYHGEWERGKMHGRGTYYYDDGKSRYEGEFKESLRHGAGTYYLEDGSAYAGSWRDGVMCGRGVFTWPDGSVYDGEWKDGKRHGQGLLRVADGFSYDGTWSNNSMEGRGSATYPNGQQYVGLFTAGRRDGRGTMHFTNGAIYEGRFRDDAVDGQGTLRLSRALVVPRSEDYDDEEESKDEGSNSKKEDFMIPLSFQSDMGHIHRKAGFTVVGE